MRDDGLCPVAAVADGDEIFAGPRRAAAPDLLVTLRPPYRFAGCNVLGGAGAQVFSDNEDVLSGESAGLAADAVPGFLISDRREDASTNGLFEVGPVVLEALGVR